MSNRTALLFGLALALAAGVASAQVVGDTAWNRYVGNDSTGIESFAADVCTDGNGYVYYCGKARAAAQPDADMVVAKLNQWGDTSWVRYIDGTASNDYEDLAHAIAVDSVGNVYVAGVLEGDSAEDMAVAKFDSLGNSVWTWQSNYTDEDRAFDIAITNGAVYACGFRLDTIWDLYAFTVLRLNPASGAVVWAVDTVLDQDAKKDEGRQKHPGVDRYPEWYENWDDWENCATAIAVAPDDGRVVATGYGYDYNDEYQMWTMKFETSGTIAWQKDCGRTTNDYDDAAFDLAIANNGDIYICGLGESVNDYDWLTARYSTGGTLRTTQWLSNAAGLDEWATGITLDDATPTQNVYVTGFVDYGIGFGRERIVTQKYNYLLTAQWGSAGALWDYAGETSDIGYDVHYADGHIYVVGQGGNLSSDIIVLCYTPDNATPKAYQWVKSLDLSQPSGEWSFECGNAVRASDSEHVYVAGHLTYTPVNQGNVFLRQDMVVQRFFPTDRDVRLDSLLAPGAQVDLGTQVVPSVRVVNEGNDRSSFQVRLYIEGSPAYYDTVAVSNLLPGQSEFAVFDTWTAGPAGPLNLVVNTALAGDRDRHNDTLATTVLVVVHDVAPTRFALPGVTVDSGAVVTPQVWFHNYGNVGESFDARLAIGSYVDTATVNVPAGDSVLQGFAQWTPVTRGNVSLECRAMLADDMDRSNDTLAGQTFVRVLDVQALDIVAPAGGYDLDDVVTPVARWRNNGNVGADFTGWMVIFDPYLVREYAQAVSVVGLGAGRDTTIGAFPPDTFGIEGNWRARCSTVLAGDLRPANDTLTRGFMVGTHPDMQVEAILAPAGALDTAEAVVPEVRLHNGGDVEYSFDAWMVLRDPDGLEHYREGIAIPGIGVGRDSTILFPEWAGGYVAGQWTALCSLAVSDENPGNDTLTRHFNLRAAHIWPPGWVEVHPMPVGTSGKAAKRGASMTVAGRRNGIIYATKGYKTGEFYSYDFEGDSWSTLAEVQPGREGKLLEKGSRLATDGDHVWLTKGNNTLGFWRYDPDANTWEQLDDIPEGPTGKKIKGGTDLVYIDVGDTGFVYMLKGYRTEFWRFNTVTGAWQQRANAPTGIKEKWDKGSWLAHDGDNTIYAHKAKYYVGTEHEFWKYDIPGDSWSATRLAGMPLYGLHGGNIKKKKAKDGGSGAWYEGSIWALKGGNTQQFFEYNASADTWVESDSMPTYGSTGKKRRVKQGGDIVEQADALWAMKGNKTLEFWRYGFPPAADGLAPGRSGTAAGPKVLPGDWTFDVRPNPMSGGGALCYAVPYATTVTARLYDATGRAVRTLLSARPVAGRGALRLDAAGLAGGVYLLKLDAAGGFTRTFKVVIE